MPNKKNFKGIAKNETTNIARRPLSVRGPNEDSIDSLAIASPTRVSRSSSSGAENVERRDIVPIRASLSGRFYEPIALLSSLNETCRQTATRYHRIESINSTGSARDAFHCLVNKLAQVCDNRRGGETVTSCIIEELANKCRFVFASNKRTAPEIHEVKTFMESLLSKLKTLGPGSGKLWSDDLAAHIFDFNRPRISMYLKRLELSSKDCLKRIELQGLPDALATNIALMEEKSLIAISSIKTKECEGLVTYREAPVDFKPDLEPLKTLLDHIGQLINDDSVSYIILLTPEDYRGEEGCWTKLKHAMGRLLSYKESIKTFVLAVHLWPRLFMDFEVMWLKSSLPLPNPLSRKKSQFASEILHRMTSDMRNRREELVMYQQKTRELQGIGLDDTLAKQCSKDTWKPLVHAEVLLLDWLESTGGTPPYRFFGGYRYIGVSKPTCRLCHYYFEAHRSRMNVRTTHRNLYANWRFPDLFDSDGDPAKSDRENIINFMISRLRVDVLKVLVDRVPERRDHDSNTELTRFETTSLLGSLLAALNEESEEKDPQKADSPNMSLRGAKFSTLETMDGEDHGSLRGEVSDSEDDEDGGALTS